MITIDNAVNGVDAIVGGHATAIGSDIIAEITVHDQRSG